jgi:hypothetical protein
LDFGSTSKPLSKSVTLTNNGPQPIEIKRIEILGPHAEFFTISTTCGLRLDSAASCSTTVTFHPPESGDIVARLYFLIPSNVNQSALLRGTGSR